MDEPESVETIVDNIILDNSTQLETIYEEDVVLFSSLKMDQNLLFHIV